MFTFIKQPKSNNLNDTEINQNIKVNHSLAVTNHKCTIPENKILEMQAPEIHHSEETLTRYHRRLLSQLRTNKSPFLLSYLHKINPTGHPSPLCPLCSEQTHDTEHLFQFLTNTDNTYSNRLMEQSLRGGRAAGYLAASPGGALSRTKIEGVSTMADPRVGNNNNII